MSTEVLETGAVFALTDRFSAGLDKLIGGLTKAEENANALQLRLDKLGLGPAVAKMRGEWTEIGAMADKGVAGIVGKFDTLGRDVTPGLTSFNASVDKAMGAVVTSSGAIEGQVVANFDKMGVAATKELTSAVDAASPTMFGAVLTSAVKMQADVIAEFTSTGTEAVKALSVSIDAAAPTAFAPLVDAAKAASGEMVSALGSLDGAIAGPLAAMRALTGEMTAAAGLMERVSAGSAAAGAADAFGGGSGGGHGVGRARHGGPHFGRVGTEIPGGHASVGGGPALAGAGILGFGIYEAAQMRDEIQKLMLTGQVDPEKFGSTREQFQKLIMDAASSTGFSVKEVGDSLAKSERALAGVDVATKMDVTQALIPYAATEARLKGTGLAEALETMVGLSHMTGTFDVEGVKELARKFSFVSLATNASLPQFEKTLSYSMPILRTGMGMAPDTIMALTAAAQNAGITSTKSGTWLRSFFESTEPEVGDGEHAKKHNAELRKMGLLDRHNAPTWKVYGQDGKVDWNKSVVNEGQIIQEYLKGVPIDDRMGVVKNIWGERGGAMASMLSMNTFMDQFSIIADKIAKFQGGSSAIEEYTKDNPAQKARETWRDFENVLMNIGDKALPTVNTALTNLDEALKRLPADWEATKAMWGFHVGQVEGAAGVAADKLKDGAGVLGKMPGPLGAPFRDQSKPAFDPNVPMPGYNPTAFVTGAGGGSLEDTIYRGTLRAFTDFAAGGSIGGVVGGGSSSGFTNAAYTTFDNVNRADAGYRMPRAVTDHVAALNGSAAAATPLLRGAVHGAMGANPYAGEAGGGSFVPPGAEATTAGMRQNNLGNIGFFPGMHYAGLLGPSNARDVDHSIAKFADQDAGIRAAASLALHKYMSGRHDTWDIIAAKGGWTPGALGPGASVNVARAMGLGNRDDVHLDDPGQMVKFLHGLAIQEHGPAGRFYSEDRIRAALQHPTVDGRRTVSPGKPAAAGGTSASNMPPVEVHLTHMLDGKVLSHTVTKHQVADARFKRSIGPTDTYGQRAHPGSEVMDA